MEGKVCTSCKKRTVNDKGQATFSCPQCSDYQIVRCTNCRSNASRYACPSCGFKGPN